jgi:hypothetical protein
MRWSSGTVCSVFLAMMMLAACSRATSLLVEDESWVEEEPDSITVAITNDNFYDARIHAQYDGGHRYSLGTVAGNGQQAEVSIRWEPRPIIFEIMFIVSGAVYLSHPVQALPGDIIEVRLPPNIDASGFFRRVRRG